MGTYGTPPLRHDEQTRLCFETSYAQWYDYVYMRAYRLVSCHDDAEDVAQAVFLKYWKAIHTKTIVCASAWLACVARRQAIDLLRRRRQRQSESPEATYCGPHDTGAVVEAALIAQWVQCELLKLDPIYRNALYQSYYCSLSAKSIALATETPIGTVKSRLRRAHRLMRERALSSHAVL